MLPTHSRTLSFPGYIEGEFEFRGPILGRKEIAERVPYRVVTEGPFHRSFVRFFFDERSVSFRPSSAACTSRF